MGVSFQVAKGGKVSNKRRGRDFGSAYPPLSWFQKKQSRDQMIPQHAITENGSKPKKNTSYLFSPQKTPYFSTISFVFSFFLPQIVNPKKGHESEELQSLCNPSEDRKLGKSFPERMRRFLVILAEHPVFKPCHDLPGFLEKKNIQVGRLTVGSRLDRGTSSHGTKLEFVG